MTDRRLSPALEVKRATVDEAGTFTGLASTWGGPPDAYGDVIARGAFSATLAQHKAAGTMPALLWCHDPQEPIGKFLGMWEDETGLRVEGKLTLGTSRGKAAYELMADGALGLSIGYLVKDWGEGPKRERVLKAVDLFEVSACAMPANPRAKILGLKSFGTIREFEAVARDALGLSAREARALASGGFPALVGRDGPSAAELGALARAVERGADELKSILRGAR